MNTSTPSAEPILSRTRLKEVAAWIRDDLDLLVAREGPDSLKPNDVLALHDMFVALRNSTTITAMDLRATAIHKAVELIASVATRWPARLCDECDKIISIWTLKFGALSDLRPFLHGRGGRLEGIGNSTEFSNQALLGRWAKFVPGKIETKVSHTQGDLGFRAGAWWIDPLFAHHAGIIGLESINGGTTFDKNGVYAIVLKDAGEVSITPEECLKYRCSVNDKGKFRLTAATPRSREPIRVLRCHNINSVWGPRAGIRYEGLYIVKGWSIRQAPSDDVAGREWRQGDTIYVVELQRKDPVPLEDVLKRPTNTELDDYMEFTRLRKRHRDQKRQVQAGHTVKFNSHIVTKGAPQIRVGSIRSCSGDWIRSTLPGSSASSIAPSRPTLDSPRRASKAVIPEEEEKEEDEAISPRTSYHHNKIPLMLDEVETSEVPVQDTPRATAKDTESGYFGNQDEFSTYSIYTSTSDLMEIAPWINKEPSPDIPSPSTDRSNSRLSANSQLDTSSGVGSTMHARSIAIDSTSHALAHVRREPTKRNWAGVKARDHIGRPNKTISLKAPHTPSGDTKNSRRGLLARSLRSQRSSQSYDLGVGSIDGGGDSTTDHDNCFPLPTSEIPTTLHRSNTHPHSNHTSRVFSFSGSSSEIAQHTRGRSLSASLKNFITLARPATPVGSPTSTAVLWRGEDVETNTHAKIALHLGMIMEGTRGDSHVTFKNPFDTCEARETLSRASSGVAPDVVD